MERKENGGGDGGGFGDGVIAGGGVVVGDRVGGGSFGVVGENGGLFAIASYDETFLKIFQKNIEALQKILKVLKKILIKFVCSFDYFRKV